ncbi:hypothetical protein J6590_064615 [Homalodisca vitripennis]|nr:hypothetical protein J6590_064615 [Homalodisca vitripennis]
MSTDQPDVFEDKPDYENELDYVEDDDVLSDLFSPDASEDEYLPTESDKEEEVSEILHKKKRVRRSFEESVEPIPTTSAQVLSEDDEDDADIRDLVQKELLGESQILHRLSIAEQLGVQVPVKPATVNRKAGRCSICPQSKDTKTTNLCDEYDEDDNMDDVEYQTDSEVEHPDYETNPLVLFFVSFQVNI